jgi:hypothetical protein
MKTAIAIPEDMVEPARELAQRAGVTVNELCIYALREYLERRRKNAVTAKINAVCDQVDTSLDPVIQSMQAASISKEKW